MNHAVLIVHAAIEPWASCRPEGLKLTLLARDAPATEVAAYTLLDNEEVRFELQPVRGTDGTAWQRWQGTVPWSDSGPNQRYVFRACTADVAGRGGCTLEAAPVGGTLPYRSGADHASLGA